jgi:UDP-N-acetylglucosamine diphosphorylase/glucosamine-1-phosphate N-acetyltransferase
MIRGPFALCEQATVKMGAKIYGATTIGPCCIAGGEIKNSVLLGYSNKAHDGYLGDSVIGEWCNLGAGSSNSNIKNTAGSIKIWNNATMDFEPAGIKCGLLMGDYSRCAINTSFNTGTVTGICCNIFGQSVYPKYIPDFSWGTERYVLQKAIQDIDNWKKLKGHAISEREIQLLTDFYSSKKTNNA